MLPVGDVGLSATGGEDLPSDEAPRGVRVTGYAGVPALHRSNRSYITLFVNRRWFQDPSLAYGVIQAYRTMLPVGRYPAAVVFIEIDPAEVDVNVHPTKAEVRFRESHAVFGAIQRAVRETLTAHAPVPSFGVPVESGGDAWQGAADWAARREALLGAGRGEFPAGDAREGGRPTVGGVQYPLTPESAVDRPTESPEIVPPKVPVLRVVGQLGATYIVAEGPDGMYLIDQHAAHERILYEQMMGQHAGQTLAVQALLEPLVLETTPEQEPWLAAALGALNEWGIAIEPFGAGGYLVRSVPAVLARDDPHAALREVVDGLAGMTDPVAAAREAALVTLICKRAAVKGGQPLALAEMQEMVRQLEACRSPRTCPHGRPTMLYLSAADLARNFERT
jgi:DNA mismatch repair protein MutL